MNKSLLFIMFLFAMLCVAQLHAEPVSSNGPVVKEEPQGLTDQGIGDIIFSIDSLLKSELYLQKSVRNIQFDVSRHDADLIELKKSQEMTDLIRNDITLIKSELKIIRYFSLALSAGLVGGVVLLVAR